MQDGAVILIRFLPVFAGSKARWIENLEVYRGRDFVEFFAGSAAISANLANRAVLNDNDPFLHKYFLQYERQPILEIFTHEDYFAKRSRSDWYRYLYYLQQMSFSGIYKWGENGYRMSINTAYWFKVVHLKDKLERSIKRFKALNPLLHNLDYLKVPIPEKPDIAILDPPYESKRLYNSAPIDYKRYWEFVHECIETFRVVVIFDRDVNMYAHGFQDYYTLKTRVVGKGMLEAMCIVDKEQL